MTTIGPYSKISADSPPFNPQSNNNNNSNNMMILNSNSNGGISSLTNNIIGSTNSIGRNGISPMSTSRASSLGGISSRSNSPYLYNTNTISAVDTQQQQQQSQQQQQQPTIARNSNAVPKYKFQYGDKTLEIRNVWADNVEEEMAVIREVVEKYPYVAMDTEFPGVVAKPVITDTYTPDYHYRSLKVNVDLLKIIQLGLSFADEAGNLAPQCPCWQFNFKFDLEDDMFAQDSIDLLTNSGISFDDHAKRGIDPLLFGELLMVSGLVLDDRVKWVSFHSGYDYGYLLKLLTTTELPADEKSFFELLKIYFPTIYDIKYMTSLLDGHQFMGGLQRLADDLQCQRMGVEHQAGSDSLLTMTSFFALIKAKFNAKYKDPNDPSSPILYDNTKFLNELFGYGTNHTVRKQQLSSAAAVAAASNINSGGTMISYNNNTANTNNSHHHHNRETSTVSVLSSGSND